MRYPVTKLQSYWLADASFATLLIMLIAAVFVLAAIMETSDHGVLLFRDQSVNAHRIVGAVNVHLLFAIMGALALEVVHAATGVSLGGGIYAVTVPAKMLATFLSTLGVLLPAIVIARLVGLASGRT